MLLVQKEWLRLSLVGIKLTVIEHCRLFFSIFSLAIGQERIGENLMSNHQHLHTFDEGLGQLA